MRGWVMQIDEIVSMIQKFIEIRRIRTYGCINFRPLDVVETVTAYETYGDGNVRKFNVPTVYNLINYTLRALTAFKLLYFTVLSDKVKYILCHSSKLWNHPELIKNYIQRYEQAKWSKYYLDVYENEGLVLFTTNIDDDELFTDVVNAIRKTIKNGFNVMDLARMINGNVTSTPTNYRIYIGIQRRDRVRATTQQRIVKITPTRKIVLMCIANGKVEYHDIVDCVREKRPSKYDDVYSIVLNALRTLCLNEILICDGTGYYINPAYQAMVQGFIKA
jgi:hypothetical protein